MMGYSSIDSECVALGTCVSLYDLKSLCSKSKSHPSEPYVPHSNKIQLCIKDTGTSKLSVYFQDYVMCSGNFFIILCACLFVGGKLFSLLVYRSVSF